MPRPWKRRTLLAAAVGVAIVALMLLALPTYRWITEARGEAKLSDADRDLVRRLGKLKPLHQKLGQPRPGDWLAVHKEPGQSFHQYAGSRPIKPDKLRHTIYVQPLGELSKTDRQIIAVSAEFIGLYYNCPVKTLEPIKDSAIPEQARRARTNQFGTQYLSTYILDSVLKPMLPKDALAYIAFTATDLWPGRGWNFVFGQASTGSRVGVWSMARFGDPDAGAAEFNLCLTRTLGTATHETGHMLSMHHCTAYQCNMCGSNSLAEGDRYPLYLCPQCVTKVCWATRSDPIKRFEKLAAFCQKHRLTEAEKYYRSAIEVLSPSR